MDLGVVRDQLATAAVNATAGDRQS